MISNERCLTLKQAEGGIRPIRMRYLKSDFCAFGRVVYGEIFALFQAWIGNFHTIPPWKVAGTLYLVHSYVTFKYFAFFSLQCTRFHWARANGFNRESAMLKLPKRGGNGASQGEGEGG